MTKILFGRPSDLEIRRVADGACRAERRGRGIDLRGLSATVQAALEGLEPGADAEALFAAMPNLRESIELLHVLELLEGHGLLARVLDGRATLLLGRPRESLGALAPDGRVMISRFAFAHMDAAQWVLESPAAPGRVTFHSAAAAGVPALIAGPTRLAGLDVAAREVVNLLWRAGLVVQIPEDGRNPEVVGSPGIWDFHDRLFHERSRTSSFRVRTTAPTPPLRRAGRLLPLPAVPPCEGSLEEALAGRSSVRDFDTAAPIRLEELSALLGRALHPRSDGRRPYPSAGGLYPIDVYAVVHRCDGLAPGLYRYDAEGHGLVQLDAAATELRPLLDSAAAGAGGRSAPQVLLVFAARFAAAFERYPGLGYAALLKDAGALMQTLYLVATSMRLGPCAIGSGDPSAFSRAAGLDPWQEAAVGEFLIGSVPDAGPLPG